MRKFSGLLLGTVLFCCMAVPAAWGWDDPLVNRLQEAQNKEKEILAALPALKSYLLSAPSKSAAQNTLRQLESVPAAGTPALLGFYRALLNYWAQDTAEAEKNLAAAKNNASGKIGELWLMTRRAYQAGWQEGALSLPETMKETAKDTGTKNLKPYAHTMLLFATERAGAGDYPGAETWLQKAELLSSSWPHLYFTRAQIGFKKGIAFFPEALKAVAAGYATGLRHKWILMSWSASFFYALGWLLIFIFVLTAFGFFIKNADLIIHDFQELFLRGHSSQVITFLFFLGLFLPLLLGFGLLWQGLFWLLLLFPYGNLKEKIGALVFGALLLLLPLLLSQAATTAAFSVSPRSQLLLTAQESGYDAELAGNLKALKQQEPKNPLIPHLLGLLYYRGGDYAQAESEFKAALELNPRWYATQVNLGNTYFGMNSLDQAAQEYQKALELHPQAVSAHYNISQIYTGQLKLSEARAEYEKAAEIDANLVGSYEQSTSPNPNRRLMEQPLAETEFLAWALPPPAEMKQFTQILWAERLAGVSLAGAPITLGIALFFIVALALVRKRKNLAYVCQKCGQAYCKKCHPNTRSDRLCLACSLIFVRMDAVVVQRKVEKQIAVQTYQQRRRLSARLLNLILPGLGHFYWGDSLKGLFFIGLVLVFLTIFILPAPAYLPPPADEPYNWRLFVGGGLLAFLYVIIQLDLHRRIRVR